MRSLRSRTKHETNSKSKSRNYNEETEIYISPELPVTTVLEEKPISIDALQRSSEDVGEKCGEVFKNKDAIFSYLCTICGTLLDGIEDFKSHVISHSNLCKIEESLDELPIKIDQNLDDENFDIDQFSNENIFSIEIKQEIDEVDEKPNKMAESETITNLKRKETIKKRKCKKTKQNVSYEISKSSETHKEYDITMRKQTRKRNRENCDQTNKLEISGVTVKREDVKNAETSTKDENIKNTTIKAKKKTIRKIKHERNHVFCQLCNKELISQMYLDSHLKYDHIARNPFVNSNIENQPDSWSDDDLDRQTRTKQTINVDKKSSIIEELDKSIYDDPLKCRYCDKRHISRMHRYEHECLHTGEKPFKCETCGKTFRQKCALDEHYIKHTTEKPHKCEICNQSYKHKKYLRIHISRHNGEKPYKCKYCDKTFTYSGNRYRHQRTHTNEKPFQCSDCGKCFESNQKLLIHWRRKHSLSKPHVCCYCGKAYAEIIDKRKHEKVHEKQGSFVCKVCNAKFSTQKGLRTHINTHAELVINESRDQSLTLIKSTTSNDIKNESNKSNEIFTSSSSSLSPPNIIENVNKNHQNRHNQTKIENGNNKSVL